ncbi:hypothetical protein ROA7450_00779 [Roseovarius albus]|uniref:Uncharacterized protein n=1 Tax=Roseovarius albus TaxID=1247867 RepID=A0A1X6YIK3_9RHOB|nr:hypothetical protein [Roseovarius albus]SLN21637.1 hypothetical protein ROA7450_00779 [Roseovarius albus]
MSDRFEISANEAGLIRLFQIDLPADEIEGFSGDLHNLQMALGTKWLNADYVEVFAVSDLKGLGLAGYMTEGLGVATTDLAAERSRLDAMQGHVLVVLSKAFDEVEQTLIPKAPLRWVGTYAEEAANITFEPLPDESAQGVAPAKDKKAPSQAAVQGKVATLVLIFLALFVWVLIKIAG